MNTDISIKSGFRRLLGISLFVQAITSLIGGAVLFEPYVSKESIHTTMSNLANHIPNIYGSVLLQIVTALVIIILGVAIYQIAGHVNKTIAMIALCFYLFEAVLVAISQVFLFGLLKVSQLYLAGGDAGLVSLGNVLLSCRDITAKMAIIPFGLGALLFYSLLMKAKIIPKWLAIWGLATVPFVLIGVPLTIFGVVVPFALFIPYVPFEFFTGIYILIKTPYSSSESGIRK
jgi:hypothetical protein